MTFIFHTPSPPLNFYINSFYCPNESLPLPREKILPLAGLDLKINFGGGFQVYDADQSEPFTTLTESWVLGLWTKYHIVDWPEDLQYLGVSFKPGGAYPFLGVRLSELQNQVVSLDAIWGRFAAELRERLYAAPTIEARFALLEQFFLARLRDTTCFAKQNMVRCRGTPQGLKVVQRAVAEIARHHGRLSIRELSERLGMSQKHLIVQFKQLVGCTPKELGRLYRFGDILASIDPTQPVDWTSVAHQFYFHDQSHFIRDFREFSGHIPTDYLRLLRQMHAEKPDRTQHLRLLPIG
jgi:AraC-like DNA-binding protein